MYGARQQQYTIFLNHKFYSQTQLLYTIHRCKCNPTNKHNLDGKGGSYMKFLVVHSIQIRGFTYLPIIHLVHAMCMEVAISNIVYSLYAMQLTLFICSIYLKMSCWSYILFVACYYVLLYWSNQMFQGLTVLGIWFLTYLHCNVELFQSIGTLCDANCCIWKNNKYFLT